MEQAQQKQEEKQKKKRWLLLLLLLLALLAGLLTWHLMQKPAQVSTIDLPTSANGDQIKKELDQKANDSQDITAYALMYVQANSKAGKWWFYNAKENTVGQQAVITLDDTKQVVYKSGLLEPGKAVENVELSEPLQPGKYKATVAIESYDLQKKLLNSSMATTALTIVVQ